MPVKTRRIAFGQYLKSFTKSFSGLAAIGFVPVIVSTIKPDWHAYMFPPLGNFDPAARLGALLLGALAVCGGYLLINMRVIRPVIMCAFALCAAGLLSYLALFTAFVRKIDIPSRAATAYVSVGYTRSEFATKNFESETDEQMLRERGLGDEEIGRLWTRDSLITARLTLYVAYLAVTLGWILAFSALMAYELSAEPASSTSSVRSRRN